MTPTCFDLMTDIETLGTRNDAAIVSIGAVFFDLATETIGESFRKNIHLATSMRDGATVDAGAILFWLRQGTERQRAAFDGGLDVKDVLRDLAIWIGQHVDTKLVRPWGNSNRFDLGILESAYQRAYVPVPWYWSNERDFRTVRNMHKAVEYDTDTKGETAHDPVVDCKFQIQHLFKIKRHLQSKNRDLF